MEGSEKVSFRREGAEVSFGWECAEVSYGQDFLQICGLGVQSLDRGAKVSCG